MIRLSVIESFPGELLTRDGSRKLEDAIVGLRSSLAKAGAPSGDVDALRELETLMTAAYTRGAEAMTKRMLSVIGKG